MAFERPTAREKWQNPPSRAAPQHFSWPADQRPSTNSFHTQILVNLMQKPSGSYPKSLSQHSAELCWWFEALTTAQRNTRKWFFLFIRNQQKQATVSALKLKSFQTTHPTGSSWSGRTDPESQHRWIKHIRSSLTIFQDQFEPFHTPRNIFSVAKVGTSKHCWRNSKIWVMNLLTTVGKLLGPFGKFCLKVPWEKKTWGNEGKLLEYLWKHLEI